MGYGAGVAMTRGGEGPGEHDREPVGVPLDDARAGRSRRRAWRCAARTLGRLLAITQASSGTTLQRRIAPANTNASTQRGSRRLVGSIDSINPRRGPSFPRARWTRPPTTITADWLSTSCLRDEGDVEATELQVTAGPDAGATHHVTRAPFSVGTADAADVHLSDPTVSRLRCEIERVPGAPRPRREALTRRVKITVDGS